MMKVKKRLQVRLYRKRKKMQKNKSKMAKLRKN